MHLDNRLVENYLTCQYKAALTLKDETGTPHDYSLLTDELRDENRPEAINALLRRYNLDGAPTVRFPTQCDLKEGHALILDCAVENEHYRVHLDALNRVEGKSALGGFYYAPTIFSQEGSVRKSTRVLLALAATILSDCQNRTPQHGFVVPRLKNRVSTVRLAKTITDLPRLLDGLQAIRRGTIEPKLRLIKSCDTCEFRAHCRAEAVQSDDLTLLRGMSDTELQRHNRNGIFTVHQLSHTFRPRRRNKRVKSAAQPFNFALQSLAIRENTVFVVKNPSLPLSRTRVYVDVEGDANGNSIYLLGMDVQTDGSHEWRSFWADSADGQTEIFHQFLTALEGLPSDCHIYHYGRYEKRAFQRMLTLSPSEEVSRMLTERTTDVLAHLRSNIYFPSYSCSLKEIAAFLGHKWPIRNASGLDTIVWRAAWERTRNSEKKKMLTEYNQSDCVALKSVVDFLVAVDACNGNFESMPYSDKVATIDDIVSRTADGPRFGSMKPAVEEFGDIVERAYFDYQRRKVYVRTDPSLRRVLRRKPAPDQVRYRVGKAVTHIPDRCPHCTQEQIYISSGKGLTKLTLDLKFTSTGIKRTVVKHVGKYGSCPTCHRSFFPTSFKNQPRFGHNLASWAMYQYVVNRMTLAQIGLTANECFGIHLPTSRCHVIKSELAAKYKPTRDKLMAKLVAGPLLHVDETKIRLKSGNGYAWVFSNMEEVVFVYRPNREAAFLHELLSGFTGVLVTDFYSGYDSLKCVQQKCLVHLIRDMNNDLLKHPLDRDLSVLGEEFGKLLRDIVATIDRFGLKRRFLKKHRRTAESWLEKLKTKRFGSNAAEKYRKRFVKYAKKLFVFLDRDGVPWNNNNAEHAIKPFAKYRRLINGQVTETGVKDYLILLSLYQTCSYKAVRFLDFLRSQETDIESFCRRQ